MVGSKKVQKYADVIQGWSLKSRPPELRLKKSIKDKDSLTRFFFEMRNHPLSRLLNAYYMGRKFKPCVPEFLDFIMGRIPGQTQCFGFCTKPFDGIFSA